MAKPIGTLGSVASLKIGERLFVDLTNLIIARGFTGNPGRYACYRKVGSSGYQVTVGKTWTLDAAEILPGTGSLMQASFTYGDNDVGYDTATVPTNNVPELGGFAGTRYTEAVAGKPSYHYPDFDIPATKYANIYMSIAGVSSVYGYET